MNVATTLAVAIPTRSTVGAAANSGAELAESVTRAARRERPRKPPRPSLQTVSLMFIDPRQFTIIVLVCRESDNSLYSSRVTVDGVARNSWSNTGANDTRSAIGGTAVAASRRYLRRVTVTRIRYEPSGSAARTWKRTLPRSSRESRPRPTSRVAFHRPPHLRQRLLSSNRSDWIRIAPREGPPLSGVGGRPSTPARLAGRSRGPRRVVDGPPPRRRSSPIGRRMPSRRRHARGASPSPSVSSHAPSTRSARRPASRASSDATRTCRRRHRSCPRSPWRPSD
jgi:hypothetical protein